MLAVGALLVRCHHPSRAMKEFSGSLRVSLDQSDQAGATLTVNLTMPSGRIVLTLPSFALTVGQTVDLGLAIIAPQDFDSAGWYEPAPGTIHHSSTASVAVDTREDGSKSSSPH